MKFVDVTYSVTQYFSDVLEVDDDFDTDDRGALTDMVSDYFGDNIPTDADFALETWEEHV